MRILIINTNRERSPHTVIPLGACFAASVAASAGHETSFLDLTFESNPLAAIKGKIREFRPDVIGLSIRNLDNCDSLNPYSYLPEIKTYCQTCSELSDAPIVIGGPAVSCHPDGVTKYLGADYAVSGDAEDSFIDILNKIDSNGNYQQRDKTSASPERWLNLKNYARYDATMPIQTKRGCLFNCSYCVYPTIEGAGIRLRDPLDVAGDVERAAKLGFRSAEFVDSVFNVPKEHAIACCEQIARQNDRPLLQVLELNPVGCDRDLIDSMNEAGFNAVGCTAESGSESMLKNLNKGFDIDVLHRSAIELKRLNAHKMWIFMLGGPGETEATVRETASFMKDYLTNRDIVYIGFGIRIMKGTKIQEIAISEGCIAEDDDLLFPKFYFSPHVTPSRAMSIIENSGFPWENVVTISDGNRSMIPFAQRMLRIAGISPPYWRFTPLWNRMRQPLKCMRPRC